jgi:hypothetical protein
MDSPYTSLSVNQWLNVTQRLVDHHPLDWQACLLA